MVILLSNISCISSEKGFKPMGKNTLSSSINFINESTKVEVCIKNISNKQISFSKPRILTGLDLKQQDKPISYNSFEFNLTWDNNKTANLQYATFKDIDISHEVVTLAPEETKNIILDLRDTLVVRRCDLVPFTECFSKGNTTIKTTLILISVTNNKHKTISESPPKTFLGKYIY